MDPRPSDNLPPRARLVRALGRLRDELVSGDGRSPSVRLRHARVRYAFDLRDLETIEPGLAARALGNFRGGRAIRLVSAADAGTRDDAARVARKLVALSREDRLRTDETGALDLCVGYPFVSGRAGGYFFRAPLVLFPAEIERDERGARNVSLRPRRGGEISVNAALLRLLFRKKDFALGEDTLGRLDELAEDPAQGPDAVLAELATLGLAFQRNENAADLVPLAERDDAGERDEPDHLAVEPSAVLGLFPQSGSDLLPDYDGLLAALGDPARDPAPLLSCAAEILPATLRDTLGKHDTATGTPTDAAAPLVPVVHADPSQRAVLRAARVAPAIVVDGPPGTGKSQVIVNLVADAVGRGLRVAVVSEKRAALDVVVQRLAAVGLRDVAALVHDVRDDRRALYDQVARRLESPDAAAEDPADEVRSAVAEAEGLERDLAARHAALARIPPGVGTSVGRLHSLASGIEAPDLAGGESLHRLDRAGLDRLLAETSGLHPYADLLVSAPPWTDPAGIRPRNSLAELDASGLRALEDELARAHAAAVAHADAATRCQGEAREPVEPPTERARAALVAAREARAARQTPDDGALFVDLVRAGAADARALDLLDAAAEQWTEREAEISRVNTRVEMDAPPALEHAVALMLAWSGRFVRYFLFAWWSARALVRNSLIASWPERSAAPLDAALLRDLADRLSASRAWRALDACAAALGLRPRIGRTADQARALLQRLARIASHARAVVLGRHELLAAGAWPGAGVNVTSADVEHWDRDVDARLALLDARDALRAAAAPLNRFFPWISPLPDAPLLAELLDAVRRDGARVAEADRRVAAARAHFVDAPMLFASLARELPRSGVHEWRLAIIRAWAESWVQRLSREDPAIAALDRPLAAGDDEAAGEALRGLWSRASLLERARVRVQSANRPVLRAPAVEKGRKRSAEQAARQEMLRECQKQRRLWPLRAFVRKFAGEGLLDALPVWLVSPETMAVLFSREPWFDLVVFDEASQCTVESGLPVLLRARRALIAGDDRQMPPTAFFAARANDGDGDGEASGDDEAPGISPADALDAESLLTLARARLPHAPLRWHYRCREEELIAFSNHAMYDGALLTVPSTATRESPPALRWEPVTHARYEGGRNEAEARRVVDVLREVLGRAGAPSVGVVTFNVVQRQAVLDEIDARREKDQEFSRRFDAAMARERVDDRPFVKNLENVQGDERDVIVFSLGHAAGAKGTVAAHFGPLSLRGGERRLNVAVSRARAECVVVASFDPAALRVENARNRGPALLKAFLEFAHHTAYRRRDQAEAVLRSLRAETSAASPAANDAGAPFEGAVSLREQVARALRAEGLGAETDVGSSEFRIPVAVFHPDDAKRYRVAVLCDEGEPAAADAFERHVQQPEALVARGWRVVRVDARAWRRNRAAELARIRAALTPSRSIAAAPAAP